MMFTLDCNIKIKINQILVFTAASFHQMNILNVSSVSFTKVLPDLFDIFGHFGMSTRILNKVL